MKVCEIFRFSASIFMSKINFIQVQGCQKVRKNEKNYKIQEKIRVSKKKDIKFDLNMLLIRKLKSLKALLFF